MSLNISTFFPLFEPPGGYLSVSRSLWLRSYNLRNSSSTSWSGINQPEWNPNVWSFPHFKHQPNVGKYTSSMDPMGLEDDGMLFGLVSYHDPLLQAYQCPQSKWVWQHVLQQKTHEIRRFFWGGRGSKQRNGRFFPHLPRPTTKHPPNGPDQSIS